ncbi:MAG: YqiJ family protein [Lentisphaeraceae bacterium]|nr:YqiJ family protein [Lentisphaeraceae bacterium]
MFNEIYEYSQQSYLALWSALMIIIGFIAIISLFTGFDNGIDFDADLDMDVDADMDGHVDAHGLFHSLYVFLNIGKTPITLILFTFVIVNWTICMSINTTFNTGHNLLLGWSIFAGAIFLSLPIVRLVNYPLKKFFGALLEDEEKQTHSIGSICTTTTEVTENNGQATFKDGPTVINLMVMTEEGKTISKGKKAIVLEKKKDLNRYIISEVNDEIFN